MTVLLDAAGRRRSPATMPGYHSGRPPGVKGMRYPADPPTVDEIVAAMRHTGGDRHGWRLRAMVVVLWRGAEAPRGARARGARPRPAARVAAGPPRQGRPAARGGHGPVGLGTAAPLAGRARRAAGRTLFCIIDGRTRGRAWSAAAVRTEFRRIAARAGVRRRFAPHQLRHAHALELAREGVPLNIIQRQLGHANLGTTSIYHQGSTPRRSSRPRARAACQ